MSSITKHVGPGTRYFSADKGRDGKSIYYFRRPGYNKIQLKELLGTAAMDRAFWAADRKVAQLHEDKKNGIVREQSPDKVICKAPTDPTYIAKFGDVAHDGEEGSLRWLCERYYQSAKFKSLSPISQQCYRINLVRVCSLRTSDGKDAAGDFDASQMELAHIEALQHQLRHIAPTADNTVKHLRVMFNWAIKSKLVAMSNPCIGVTWLAPYDDDNAGHLMWEDEHHEMFVKRWPVGTSMHALWGLMFYGGVRISDAFRMGPFHIKKRGTELHWTEWKGSRSTAIGKHRPKPKHRELIMPAELKAILAASESQQGLYALQSNGQAFKPSSAVKVFKRACRAAGLPEGYTAHGVRKAAAALMYEQSGGDLAMMCDWFGWKLGSVMAVWYAKRFNRQRTRAKAVAIFNARSSKKEAA